jgi:hypothetical protein
VTETRYEADFYAWLQTQSAHLRAKEWNGLDIDNLAEELDTLARQHLTRRLQDSPSLQPELPAFVAEAYTNARHLVAVETDLPIAAFPETCPWTLDQLQDEAFLPPP